MTVTVKDVAQKAGVAISTVSRVINDHPSISAATKKRVRQVMVEMNFVPNQAAQNLSNKKAGAIGVVLPPLDSKERASNPFFLEVLAAINAEALAHNKTTALATAKNYASLLENVKKMHLQRQVDGFILTYSDQEDPVIQYLFAKGIPFSLIGQPQQHNDKITHVDNDNLLLGKEATQFLVDWGHKNILFVTNNAYETVYFERFLGYQEALKIQHLEMQVALKLSSATDYERLEKMLTEKKFSAAVVMDDLLASQMMHYLQQKGYQIPTDLSLVSFNNSIFATMVSPQLTSFDVCVTELGKKSTEQLIQLIAGEVDESLKWTVSHQLIQRQSVKNIS